MTKIDDILDRLQKEQPVIDTPNELTERIMDSLPDRRTDTGDGHWHQKAWLYTIIGAVAASVALLLMLPHPTDTNEGERQQLVMAHPSAPVASKPDRQEKNEVTTADTHKPRPIASQATQRTGAGNGAHKHIVATAARKPKRETLDTLGNGIWRDKENVARAMKMLADCEATITREHQQVRNSIIEATFNGTPQPAEAILVTNELGDREVMSQKTIIDI